MVVVWFSKHFSNFSNDRTACGFQMLLADCNGSVLWSPKVMLFAVIIAFSLHHVHCVFGPSHVSSIRLLLLIKYDLVIMFCFLCSYFA